MFQLTQEEKDEVITKVVVGGTVRDHNGINLPGVRLSEASVTEKDKKDIRLGLKLGMDIVAVSFVRSPEDVLTVRRMIRKAKKKSLVLAKIEHPDAVKRLDEILDVGTGTGRFPLAMLGQKRFEGRVWGVDLSIGMLRRAAERAELAGVDAKLENGHVLVKDGLIDAISAAPIDAPDVMPTLLGLCGLDIPDSVQATVLARLDRLPEEHKLSAKVASVIGRVFEFDLLAASHPVHPVPHLQRQVPHLAEGADAVSRPVVALQHRAADRAHRVLLGQRRAPRLR